MRLAHALTIQAHLLADTNRKTEAAALLKRIAPVSPKPQAQQ